MFDASDHRYMRKAIALAKRSIGLASPNPAVGCVIVRDGSIVGQGYHEYALREHAEIRALRAAGASARGATAYVTLEPCCHFGRTPPCVGSLIEAGIRRVVVACMDPNPRVSGKGIAGLRTAGVQVDVGLLERQAGELIEGFARHITSGMPLVVCKVGMSLDGKIGSGRPEGRWITSPEGREFGQYLRLIADAILVGIGTVLADDPELTYRARAPKARSLTRVVLDPFLQTPPHARLFNNLSGAPVLLFCGPGASKTRRLKLERPGVEILTVSRRNDQLDLKAVLQELGKRNILTVLVEGGSNVHWSFVSEGLVDKFYFIIAPVVLGGLNAIPSVGGKGYKSVAEAPRFRIRSIRRVGPDIVLESYPSFSRSIISPWLCS